MRGAIIVFAGMAAACSSKDNASLSQVNVTVGANSAELRGTPIIQNDSSRLLVELIQGPNTVFLSLPLSIQTGTLMLTSDPGPASVWASLGGSPVFAISGALDVQRDDPSFFVSINHAVNSADPTSNSLVIDGTLSGKLPQ
jgi:hypothetical protein